MHSLSFLSSGRNWKVHAASSSVLTRIEGARRGICNTSFSNTFTGCCYQRKRRTQALKSAVQLPPDWTNQTLESTTSFPATVYRERLEESVKLIKNEREWEGSTRAALKDREGFYKVANFAQSDSVFCLHK